MAVTYSTATKTARMNAVVTQIGTNGKFKLYAADDTTLLASFTLASTAGTVSGAVLTLADNNGGSAGVLSTTAIAAGTAAKARITTAADVDVITGLLVGTDVTIDNPVFAAGQSIVINNATFTHG